MSVQSVDRRIIRTKRRIREALAQLIEEKGFETITIRDLTERADINRGTFYLHYRDKFDLLEQCEYEIFQEIEDVAKGVNLEDLKNFNEKQKPLVYTVKLLEYIKDNATFMKAVLGPNGKVVFQIKLKEYIKLNVGKVFLKETKEENMKVPKEYLVSYLVSAHLGVIQEWLEKGLKEEPKEIALYIATISFMGPFEAGGFKK
ncbi:TetR/AcrR family transcriptional regulator [Priestia sp. GS2]|uniref:TetR/AcrR family transcriptional regulator n=1 Tax=Priestia sp. GS2 TaxID=3117403 RepID=UPI002ED83E3D